MPDLPTFLNSGGLLLAMILTFAWWIATTNKESDR